MYRLFKFLVAAAMSALLLACGGGSSGSVDNTKSTLTLTSVAGLTSGALPVTFTCDGSSVSPALAWANAPTGTTNFAVVMSTIPGPGTVKYNWLIYNIPSGTSAVAQGAIAGGNYGYSDDGGGLAYAPPCSSGAGTKDYTFTVYALSAPPPLPTPASAITGSVLVSALSSVTLGSASVTLSNTRTQATINCKQMQKSLGSYAVSNGLSISCGYLTDTANAYFNTPGIQTANPMMTGITQTILQVPTAQNFTGANAWKIPLVPAIAPAAMDANSGPIGVAVNGIPIFNPCKQMGCDPSLIEGGDTKVLGELDTCNGHAGRADDYHYHAAPVCMMAEQSNAHFWDTNPIGWALDGFAIFGYNNPDGSVATRDGTCGGNTLAHENAPAGYAYHVTDASPYVLSCFKGTPVEDVSSKAGDKFAVLHVPSGPGGGSGASNMLLDTNASKLAIGGTSTLAWTNSSVNYQILYTRTSSLCWTFVFKTAGTTTDTQNYCRAF